MGRYKDSEKETMNDHKSIQIKSSRNEAAGNSN